MLRLILFSLLLLSANGKKKEDLRKVHLEGLGNVLGMKFWDGEFYEFYGIPYATAPKGRGRFKPPLPPNPWEEDMKANRADVTCQQVMYSDEIEDIAELFYGEEDCLVASLMVPKRASDTNRVPVIVYIHSGAYFGGRGNMAKYHHLARQDIIVANINYRVGALGFACLGTEDIPGNAALKDIVTGLKFIKKHIKSFGGDPDNITLAGFSIGASLAELVALSKETKGMFNKLALDSGSALNPFAVNRDPINTAKNIAISIGYKDTGNIDDLNEFYLEADLQELLAASRQIFLKNSTFGFTPCIENPSNPGAILTESPLDTIKRGDYGDFAIMTGFGNMEGISRTSQFEEWSKSMDKNLADFLPADLAFPNDKERDDFVRKLKKQYFDDKSISNSNTDSVLRYIDYFSDSMFKYSILRSAKLYSENLKRSIFIYEFSYVGKLCTKHSYMDRIRGASHRDASAYVLDFYDWTRNYTDMDMRDLMTTMWADFAKFENPTAYESSLLDVKWLKYKNEDPNYLDIGDKLVMKKNPFTKAYQLWDSAYSKYYWTPSAVNPNAFRIKDNTTPGTPVVKKPVKEPTTKPASQQPTANSNASPGSTNKETAKPKPEAASTTPKTTDSKKNVEKKPAESRNTSTDKSGVKDNGDSEKKK